MSDDKIGARAETDSELGDGEAPIAFFLSAESFLRSAILTHDAFEVGALRLRFQMPIYYLYSHCIELTLKAFLRVSGSRAWGHDLLKLWGECVERGLLIDPHTRLITGAVIKLLAQYALTYEFRYVRVGFKTLPTLDEVREVAEALQAAVRPAAIATVTGEIPERG